MLLMAKANGGKGRSAGEGHVRWNSKLGVWEARLYVPVKLRHLYGGKRVLPFYSKLEHVALEKREAAKKEMDEGRGRSRGVAFGEHLKRWLDAIGSLGTVSDVTLSDYRYHAERYLVPPERLGDVPLSDLTAEDLDALYARLVKEGVGARTVNHVHSTARVALQRAVKKRLIPYNPARDADPPRYSTSEREYLVLSEEDVASFFAAAEGDRFEAFFVAAVLSGARPAELRALKWEDLDLERGNALLRRTVSQARSGPPVIRNTTKTGKPRSVPLLPEVVSALKAHRARQNEERLALGELWQDIGLVFPDSTGGIMRRENLSKRHFKPILKKAGLPKEIRVYDLRHSFGTLWVEWGEDYSALQRIMGHARIETTMNNYVHPSERARTDAMARFGERFRKRS
jgi:integrase